MSEASAWITLCLFVSFDQSMMRIDDHLEQLHWMLSILTVTDFLGRGVGENKSEEY